MIHSCLVCVCVCVGYGVDRNARAYIRPLGSAHCPTPATQKRRRPRDTGGTPEGIHPTPWQCTLSHASHAKAAETKGHRRVARAYIRPLGSAHCPTPTTQKRRRARESGGLPRKSGGDQATLEHRRDAKAYIRPVGNAHCPTPAKQKWQRCMGHRRNARAYIRPLGVYIVPRLPRKSSGDQGTPEGRQGVHLTPWQCTLSHA